MHQTRRRLLFLNYKMSYAGRASIFLCVLVFANPTTSGLRQWQFLVQTLHSFHVCPSVRFCCLFNKLQRKTARSVCTLVSDARNGCVHVTWSLLNPCTAHFYNIQSQLLTSRSARHTFTTLSLYKRSFLLLKDFKILYKPGIEVTFVATRLFPLSSVQVGEPAIKHQQVTIAPVITNQF